MRLSSSRSINSAVSLDYRPKGSGEHGHRAGLRGNVQAVVSRQVPGLKRACYHTLTAMDGIDSTIPA